MRPESSLDHTGTSVVINYLNITIINIIIIIIKLNFIQLLDNI